MAHQRDEERPAGVELAAGDPHRSLPRVSRWIGRITMQDEDDEDDGQGGGEADLALEEGEDVDLDAGHGGGVARTAAGRHVHDVERRERGDHRDRDAHADLVPQARHGDVDELLEPARAVDPGRLEQRRSILVMPVSSRTVQNPSRTQIPMMPTAGRAVSKSPSQARVTSPRPIAVEDLVDETGQGQQPAPDDARRDERDDLRQEQDRPRDRSEPPGRDAMDDARGHQARGRPG